MILREYRKKRPNNVRIDRFAYVQCDECGKEYEILISNRKASQKKKLGTCHEGLDYCKPCAFKKIAAPKLKEIQKTPSWKEKQHLSHKGQRQYQWRLDYKAGKASTPRGYIQVQDGNGRLRPEHAIIVEKLMGRLLTKEERIHHINLDKSDNRVENLWCCVDQKQHMLLHAQLYEIAKELIQAGVVVFKDGVYSLNTSGTGSISFDDFLLVPQFNVVNSRLDTDLTTRLTKTRFIDHPICSTNMSTITELEMMKAMDQSGSVGFLHRFMSIEKQLEIIYKAKELGIRYIVPSLGVKEHDFNNLSLFNKAGIEIILIDVAHAHSTMACRLLEYSKEHFPNIEVIIGNICTSIACHDFCRLGAGAIRVGIGGGSQCLTRSNTGHGVSTLQSIIDCYSVSRHFNVPLIADGGFRNSGDIVKALGFGAEAVSLGWLLSASSDTPGEVININGSLFKQFYGMASKEAQVQYLGKSREDICPEGKSELIIYRGDTKKILGDLVGGIRSGLTYSGARTLREFREKVKARKITDQSKRESKL
jgi:IMP dehydrogenase